MNTNNVFAQQANGQGPGAAAPGADSGMQNVQQGYQEALEFQRWVSDQAQVLGRLKVFHTMAKSINDQQ